MEYSRFDPAESVITIRISLKEYEKVSKWVDEENAKTFRYRNKATISKLTFKQDVLYIKKVKH